MNVGIDADAADIADRLLLPVWAYTVEKKVSKPIPQAMSWRTLEKVFKRVLSPAILFMISLGTLREYTALKLKCTIPGR